MTISTIPFLLGLWILVGLAGPLYSESDTSICTSEGCDSCQSDPLPEINLYHCSCAPSVDALAGIQDSEFPVLGTDEIAVSDAFRSFCESLAGVPNTDPYPAPSVSCYFVSASGVSLFDDELPEDVLPWPEEDPTDSGTDTPDDSNTDPGNTYPGDTDPGNTYPGNTDPGNTDPGNTYPGNTYPGNTYPGNTYPGNTYPGDTDPGDTDPGDTDPGDTDPGDTDPGDTDPGDTDPGDTDPGDTDPGDTDPGDTDPGDTDPGDTDPGNTDDALDSQTQQLYYWVIE